MGYPPYRSCTPRMLMRRIVSSLWWETLASHSWLAYYEQASFPSHYRLQFDLIGRNSLILNYAECFFKGQIFCYWIHYFNKYYSSMILFVLSQYVFFYQDYVLVYTQISPFTLISTFLKLFVSCFRSTMLNFTHGEFVKILFVTFYFDLTHHRGLCWFWYCISVLLSRRSYQAWKALDLHGFVSLPIQTEIKLGNTCIIK